LFGIEEAFCDIEYIGGIDISRVSMEMEERREEKKGWTGIRTEF
jgi:hypothetical protein